MDRSVIVSILRQKRDRVWRSQLLCVMLFVEALNQSPVELDLSAAGPPLSEWHIRIGLLLVLWLARKPARQCVAGFWNSVVHVEGKTLWESWCVGWLTLVLLTVPGFIKFGLSGTSGTLLLAVGLGVIALMHEAFHLWILTQYERYVAATKSKRAI